MNLQHFYYHPLIPLRTRHLTLTSLNNTQKNAGIFLTSGARQLALEGDGRLQANTLLLQVTVTDGQATIGFAQVGSILCYHSVSSPYPLGYMTELLEVLLNFSFFVLNKPVIQLLLRQPNKLLADAYTALEPAGSPMQIAGALGIIVQRTDFYQRHLVASTPLTLAVAALLLRADGAILLSHPPADKRDIPSWELPGGKVDAGESPAVALVRELQEELGITLAPASLIPLSFATEQHAQQSLLVHFYLSRNWTQAPDAQEQQSLAWVLPEQIHHYPMQVAHQVAFYQLAYQLGRHSPKWAQYAKHLLCY